MAAYKPQHKRKGRKKARRHHRGGRKGRQGARRVAPPTTPLYFSGGCPATPPAPPCLPWCGAWPAFEIRAGGTHPGPL
ncbi:hypothetical protein N7471_001178 [Penicillium samsonianum]|uniref:uncharacterized protein n=1 Tax=Penicillium samsonianum TaxID=1882272 RepID=UPI002546A400|nr:uncharacterized protein N7471_001178 [Penicillium samsonianum]KAJ6149979.1 hypothetical protein N7471_001178 [Penicillium samsonianum]